MVLVCDCGYDKPNHIARHLQTCKIRKERIAARRIAELEKRNAQLEETITEQYNQINQLNGRFGRGASKKWWKTKQHRPDPAEDTPKSCMRPSRDKQCTTTTKHSDCEFARSHSDWLNGWSTHVFRRSITWWQHGERTFEQSWDGDPSVCLQAISGIWKA